MAIRKILNKTHKSCFLPHLDEGVHVSEDLRRSPEHMVDVKPKGDHPQARIADAARLMTAQKTNQNKTREDDGKKQKHEVTVQVKKWQMNEGSTTEMGNKRQKHKYSRLSW